MSQHRFLPHVIASATGAANDNLFKQVFTVALTGWALRHGQTGAAAEQHGQMLTQIAGLVFLVPFALLAPLAGALGDRLPRNRIAQAVRGIELVLVCLGAYAFSQDHVGLMLLALGALAIQSAFFSPAKLSLISDLVAPARVSSANGMLQAVTIVAILAGTALAVGTDPVVQTWVTPGQALWGMGMVLAAIGAVAAFGYPRLQPSDRNAPLRPFALHAPLVALGKAPGLVAPALALGGFWGLAAAANIQVLTTGKFAFGLDQSGCAILILILSGGIILGALCAPRWESRAFPAGLPLVGAAIAAITLAFAGTSTARGNLGLGSFGWCLFITGFGCGLWEVPLQNLLLQRAPVAIRNQVMSGAGMVGTLAMLATIALCLPLSGLLHLSAPAVLATLAWITLAFVIVVALKYRRQLGAWLLGRAIRICYPIQVEGLENLPESGGCVVICNHLSYADGLILGSCLPRPARYLVYRTYLKTPVVGWILSVAGAIPISAEHGRRALTASIDAAVEAASAGEVVVIFPEGKITRGGQMDSFRAGMERIAGRAGVPIVPAYLHGLWGALASRAPKRGWNPLRRVALRLGAPLPATTDANAARNQVLQLSYDDAQHRATHIQVTLGSAFLTQAKRHPRRIAVQDAGGSLGTLTLAGLAQALWPRLGIASDERRVGILLPPGRAGAIVNVACALAGRTAVNLNHTVGPGQLQQLCDLAGVRTVISAGPYLAKIGDISLTARMVQVEDLLKGLSRLRILRAMLGTLLLPATWLAQGRPEDVAAIIFSSGSTGMPKGVELTHRHILANCAAVTEAMHLVPGQDVILSPLPLFHSFGLIPGTWLGLVTGLRIANQPDPRDGAALGKLAAAAKATFLLGTPTFVRGWLRRIEPEQFQHLRYAVVGAERCDSDLKRQFKDRYGADLLEGYGCTELSPVATLNLPDVAHPDGPEIRSREGSVGRPLPGIHVFTVHPESKELLLAGAEGLLIVRSAARMRGYLDRDDLSTAAFIHAGYNTGDIGRVDRDGFVFITGRLARFAKIGGEMVPLDNVEVALQNQAGDEVEVAVAAIPDPAKGERLIVLTTGTVATATAWLAALDSLPALWRPKAGDIRHVEAIPKLGTGKRDLGGIKRLALGEGAGP